MYSVHAVLLPVFVHDQVQGPLKVNWSWNQGTAASNQNSQGFWSMKSVSGLEVLFRGAEEGLTQVPWQRS